MTRLLAAIVILCVCASAADAQKFRPRIPRKTTVGVNPSPACTITGPASAPTTGVSAANVQLAATCTDNVSVLTVAISCSGVTTIASTPVDTFTPGASVQVTKTVTLNAGLSNCDVIASDGTNSSPSVSIGITYTAPDSTAPVVTISQGGSLGLSAGPASLTGTATDAVGVSGSVTWLNVTTSAGGSCTGPPSTNVAWSCTATVQNGAQTVRVQACDARSNCGTADITVTVTQTLSFISTTMPNGTQDVAYSFCPSTTGGTGTRTVTKIAGSLPAGLSFAAQCVTGTPTGNGTTMGHQYRVTDSAATTADSASMSLTINAPGAGDSFYTTMSGMSSFLYGSALKTAADITAWRSHTVISGSGWSQFWRGTDQDTEALALNAAELTQDPAHASLSTISQQMYVVVGKSGTEDMWLVWDEYNHQDFTSSTSCAPLGVINDTQSGSGGQMNYKTHRIEGADPAAGAGDTHLIYQLQGGFVNAGGIPQTGNCTDIYKINSRFLNVNVPAGVYNGSNQLICTGPGAEVMSTIAIPHSLWVRHVMRITLNQDAAAFAAYNVACPSNTVPAGTYHQISHGVFVEGTGAIKWEYKDAPIGVANGAVSRTKISNIIIGEHNTSTNANPATGVVTIAASTTTTLPSGTSIRTASGTCVLPRICYTTTGSVTITGGSTNTVQVTQASAQTPGPTGNITTGTALVLGTANANITSITANADFTGGSYLFTGDAHSYWRSFGLLQNPSAGEITTLTTTAPTR